MHEVLDCTHEAKVAWLRIADLPHCKNSPHGEEYHLMHFAEAFQPMLNLLQSKGLRPVTRAGKGEGAITANVFELQTWTQSLPAHKDDATKFFAVLVLDVKPFNYCPDSGYEPPVLDFHGVRYGRRQVAYLRPGSVAVFNPRQFHGLYHTGSDVTLALLAVEWIPKPKKAPQ